MALQLHSEVKTLESLNIEDVYSWPAFVRLMKTVFHSGVVSSQWRAAVRSIAPDASVLEIGAGSGCLSAVLLGLSFNRLDLLERNKQFAHGLRRVSSRVNDTQVHVIHAEFPVAGLGQYDAICLHQNTLLEILNERGWRMLADLHRATARRGVVLCDYIDAANCVFPERGVLFKGRIVGGGHVEYKFRTLARRPDWLEARLYYRYVPSGGESVDRTADIKVWAPTLQELTHRCEVMGFSVRTVPMPDAHTFFFAPMQFLSLRRREH